MASTSRQRKLKWTFEVCQAEALKYSSRKEWEINSRGSYDSARRSGIMDQCTAHMGPKKGSQLVTFEMCLEDARKFSGRMEWKRHSRRLYELASRNGWLEECTAHMPSVTAKKWTAETCAADALRFSRRSDWQKQSSVAYLIAAKNGWLKACCSHMPSLTGKKWTKKLCLAEALKAGSAGKWQELSPSSRVQAFKRGWYREIIRIVTRKNKV